MCGWKSVICFEFILFGLISARTNSQGLSVQDWIGKQFIQASLVRNLRPEKIRVGHELDYSLSANCLLLMNSLQNADASQAGLCQTLKFRCSIENGTHFNFTAIFFHNLGFRHYFDSITQLSMDDNSLTTRLDLKLLDKFTITFNSNLTSRLLKGFDYLINDSGQQVRILNSAFLTPLIWIFSWGLGYSWIHFGSLNLGITGGKVTYIRESDIFRIRGIDQYYGIEKGKNHLLEYGMTFHLMIDKDLYRSLHWNCDLLLFKNYNTTIDMAFNNLFGFRINKFLKTSLSTKILYEDKLSKHLQIENLVSIGFYIHL